MPRLLFEIGCEELPASTCRAALVQLPDLCKRHLDVTPTEVLVGPRRLALTAELPLEVRSQRVDGPPEHIAFDDAGRPTKAGDGFARKVGVPVQELDVVGGVLTFSPDPVSGASFAEERLGALVADFFVAKPMVWDRTRFPFSRPIRWLCAKLGKETLHVEIAGVRSGSASFGHRFAYGSIDIPAAELYADTLRAAGVEPSAEARRSAIVAGLDALGGWTDPAGVLEEVVHLVESVRVLEGSGDPKYLELPERVIVSAMQAHQRYFPLGGVRFAFVANGGDDAVVAAGNEQVLEGRLEDASFTYQRDLAAGIDELASRLSAITFVARAGSYADKAQRLERLTQALGGDDRAVQAARLAKADQTAELVREFPDLEGHIGAHYARAAGRDEAIAIAVEEHYLPDAAGGPLPSTDAGRTLAAAERIDNLTVAFALSQRPTGSRDPYGLRRAATGLARLALEADRPIDVAALVASDHTLLQAQGADLSEESSAVATRVADFVEERLEGLLGLPVEYVRAARASALVELRAKARLARALAELEPGRLERLHTVYTRTDRIVSKADEDGSLPPLRPELLMESSEREVAEAQARVAEKLGADAGVDAAIAAGESLAEPLERFFEEVLVMAEDPAVRRNRLRLLSDLRDTLRAGLGDLTQIPL